jgi:tetrahedral aminopeptidase
MSAKPGIEPRDYRPGAAQIRLLKQLSEAVAVSGDEGEVRAIVMEQVRTLVDEVRVDALGNVLATRTGGASSAHSKKGGARLRVMLSAHMDEIGFMLTQDEGDGIYRFDLVGGLDERQLVGKAVWVGRGHIPGVIGAKPIHLTTPEERKRAISLDALRIDVGPGGNKGVKVGDRAAFATPFARLGPSLRGKALDDRLGVVTLIELVRLAPPNVDLLAAFTVQEEVGLRGAQVAAYAFDPDLAIAIDSTPALDLLSWDDDEEPGGGRYNTILDGGPAIYVADGATLGDPRLIRWLIQSAESWKIPYQLRQPGGGGTDAGAIHLARSGVPSVSVSIPGRYAHTPAGLARLSDWRDTVRLLLAALSRLDPEILDEER